MPQENSEKKKKLWYRKKSVALLTRWVSENTHVEFIGESGLRYPGSVTTLGSDGFLFMSESGAHRIIFPSIWTSVTAERDIGAGGDLARIHIEEYGVRYSLVKAYVPATTNVEQAEELLAAWCSFKLQQLYVSTGEFPTKSFLGSIEKFGNYSYILREKNSTLTFAFSLKDKTCKIERMGDKSAVHIIDPPSRQSIFVSETAFSAADLIERFSHAGRAIH
jgi:hypothetical protein